ncbi:Flagellin [Poriferisphaera corsica]|uniref:Flagellin n=1 Tax=Poriferisphaera corsica TaxID=2528020 RepID=A0A517YWA2_9BACT|nr:flagellin [Poriferisphaera corsica]QDU34511.1 Flagellin [Poriferisphaera corsica]
MSRINTNVQSLISQRTLASQNKSLNGSLERLSTGLRINRGKDDPAGLIASENLRSEKASIGAAISNAGRADQVMNIAEGGLQEINSLLLEVQSLVTGSANDAGLSKEEKEANQLQIDSILETIDRISTSTSFQGTKLLNGTYDFTISGQNGVVDDVKVNAAKLSHGENRDVNVLVTKSAQHAGVLLSLGADKLDLGGMSANGTDKLTAADKNFIFEIAGAKGSKEFTFASGTTLNDMIAAINTYTDVTGLSATLSGGTAISLKSNEFGSDEYVSVKVIDDGDMDNNVTGPTTGIYKYEEKNGNVAHSTGIGATIADWGTNGSWTTTAFAAGAGTAAADAATMAGIIEATNLNAEGERDTSLGANTGALTTSITGIANNGSAVFTSYNENHEQVRYEVSKDGTGNISYKEVTEAYTPNADIAPLLPATWSYAEGKEPERDSGQDVGAIVNGVVATADGKHITVRTDVLDTEIKLSDSGAQSLNSVQAFTITGGGAQFNLGPSVDIINQAIIGISNVSVRNLGTFEHGYLDELGSSKDSNLVDGNLSKAQKIVDDAINQVSSLRGRIGAFQKNTIGSTINSLSVALENTSAAESSIRDTDFAAETAEMTRSQILSQAAQTVLGTANSSPQAVLSLLG